MATGLIYRGNISANGGRVLKEFLLADSTEFTIGDALKGNGTTAGLILWGAGGAGLGPIVEFRKSDGSPVTDDGAGGDFADTYTTPASNTVVAVVDVSKDSIYSIDLDAASGTTTGSDVPLVNIDLLAASAQLDESSVVAGTASFQLLGDDTDPNAASNAVLVHIQESQWDL